MVLTGNCAQCVIQQWTVGSSHLAGRTGAMLAKVDVAHGFRNIPVHPEDRHLLSMRWGNDILIDMTLPFGLRSSPKIFTTVAFALGWVFLHCGVLWDTHYVH